MRVAFVVSLLVVALTACRRPPAPAAAPVTTPAVRIVAGSVFAAEVLLDLVPREHIAGVHVLAADARYSFVADRVAGMTTVGAEPEELLSLRPDLVILDAFTRPETVALLQAAGVRLLRPPQAGSFADIWRNVRLIGTACGCEAAAERLVAGARQRLEALSATAEHRRDWRLLGLDGALHTYGEGSLFDAVVGAAGAQNLALEYGVRSFRKLDVETVMAMPADAFVIGVADVADQRERQWIEQHPGLRLLPCVQRGRLLFVPAALLGSNSHHLAGAAEFVARELERWGRP